MTSIFFSKTFEEHIRDRDTIFKRLGESGLKVNLEQTQFMNQKVWFLGYIVTCLGIFPDLKKIEAIESLFSPTNLKELKRFLGLSGYYKKFIKKYANIAKPLTNMTRGEFSRVKVSQSRKIKISLAKKLSKHSKS